MKKARILMVILVISLLLLVASLATFQSEPVSVQAGPLAIPTSIGAQAGGGDWLMVTYSTSDFVAYTTTVTSGSKHAPAYTAVDLTWTVDISSTAIATCTIQFSNDNSTWATGEILFAAEATDVSCEITQTALFARYHRIQCTENGTDPVTTTLIGKLMN